MNQKKMATYVGVVLSVGGVSIGYVLSEMLKRKALHATELDGSTTASATIFKALISMDVGCFLSLVGIAVLTVTWVRSLRTKRGHRFEKANE
jgi:hypothetical protein